MPDVRNLATTAPSRPALTRIELLARWNTARRRREAAPLGGEEHAQATIEVGQLEVMINALDVEASEGRRVEPAHRAEPHHS